MLCDALREKICAEPLRLIGSYGRESLRTILVRFLDSRQAERKPSASLADLRSSFPPTIERKKSVPNKLRYTLDTISNGGGMR